jgi:hypothetical protein
VEAQRWQRCPCVRDGIQWGIVSNAALLNADMGAQGGSSMLLLPVVLNRTRSRDGVLAGTGDAVLKAGLFVQSLPAQQQQPWLQQQPVSQRPRQCIVFDTSFASGPKSSSTENNSKIIN